HTPLFRSDPLGRACESLPDATSSVSPPANGSGHLAESERVLGIRNPTCHRRPALSLPGENPGTLCHRIRTFRCGQNCRQRQQAVVSTDLYAPLVFPWQKCAASLRGGRLAMRGVC